eukprot:TRINITY_DN1884_c0_g1_i1.p1 TRINITY_DN1884_c0_g1~~TRINITY_DN1884_c0_g1_i1.p1  ORF type:complete len:477 (+),score=149.38 TRINITY_DN1884_c0_g1_i1:131-1432(+)
MTKMTVVFAIFHVLLLLALFPAPQASAEFVVTEINFDFNRAVTESSCKRGSEQAPVTPVTIKFAGLIDSNRPSLSKLLCDSYSLAVSDLNDLSSSLNQKVHFNITFEDTRGNSTFAAQKARYLQSQGVRALFGPVNPEEETVLIPLAQSLSLTTISATSMYPYAIPGRASYRLTGNDADRANTMAYFLRSRGIQVGVVVYKASLYGSYFQEKFRLAWQNLGGNATYTVPYPVNTADVNSTNIWSTVERVMNLALSYSGQSRGAIVLIGEEEWPTVAAGAKTAFLLRQFWLGDVGVNRVRTPGRDAINLAKLTPIHSINVYIPSGPTAAHVKQGLKSRGYNSPDPTGYLAYDSIALAGHTYFAARTDENPSFSAALRTLAPSFYGSSGSLTFDFLNNKQYVYYEVDVLDTRTGQWKLVTVFDPLPTSLQFITPF